MHSIPIFFVHLHFPIPFFKFNPDLVHNNINYILTFVLSVEILLIAGCM